VSYKDELDR